MNTLSETGITVNGIMMIGLTIGIVFTLIKGNWIDALELAALLVIVINSSAAIYKR